MLPAEAVLICALSGRALARSARAAGFAPIVLDAFGDLDTRAAAAAWLRVPVDSRWRFRRKQLLAAAARLAPPPVPLVWGSGFERAPELLAELAEGRPLWGAEPAAVRAVKDPMRLAVTARSLGIAHPEVRTQPPRNPQGWLWKRAGGAGGGHVRRAGRHAPPGRGWYWQREARGRPVSALVAGDGSAAWLLGTSEQFPAGLAGRPFRFGGVVAPARMSAAAEERLAAAATRLVAHYRIRGTASVDALVEGDDEVTVLEINPRPGASLDAHEQAYGLNLFEVHRRACARSLPSVVPPAVCAAGSGIVYARRACRVPSGFAWPDWAADRTPPLARVRSGGPICTVLARGDDAEAVRSMLAARTAALRASVERSPLTLAARRRSSAGPPSPGALATTVRAGTEAW